MFQFAELTFGMSKKDNKITLVKDWYKIDTGEKMYVNYILEYFENISKGIYVGNIESNYTNKLRYFSE